MLNHLEGVVYGDNPRNGYVRNGVFMHPELRFQFNVPGGYQVANEASRVLVVEANGRAYATLELSQQTGAQQAASAFGGQQGLTVADSGTDRFNGLAARYVLAEAQTEQGNLAVLAYFVEYGGRVYQITGITAAQTYQTYQSAFQAIARSFRPLTDPSALNVQPARIDVVQVPRATSFQNVVGNQLPFDITVQDLAIANQVDAGQTIPAGTRIKTIKQ